MKRFRFLSAFIFSLFILTFCKNGETNYESNKAVSNIPSDSAGAVSIKKMAQLGKWVEKGTECYGIVIVKLKGGIIIGKAVKCKVMAIKPEKIKLKTLESVSLMEGEGCDKLGLGFGDTWWESEGDLYKTREDADNYLHEKGWAGK